MRTKQLRRAILDTLSQTGGFALEAGTLRLHTGDLVRPRLTDEEWASNAEWLEKNGYIVRVPSSLDEDLVQWAITERGVTLLRTL